MRKKHRSTDRSSRHVPRQKPRGSLQARVNKVGPERLAIIPVDSGEPEVRARVADFYGNVLLEPFTIHLTRPGLEFGCGQIRDAMKEHRILDCVCAIETTGRYHRPVRKAFEEQNWDTRDVHPSTSSLIRRSADIGTKTDDIDLAAIHRAAMDGLAMRPEVLTDEEAQFRALVRNRRDWVDKVVKLKLQLKETIHSYLPGYTSRWTSNSFWDSSVGVTIATTFPSAQAMCEADDDVFVQTSRDAGTSIQRRTIQKLRLWAERAAAAGQAAATYFQYASMLWYDLRSKLAEISSSELDIAEFLCQRRGVRLLAFPGMNVVSAADYVAELGPISNYAKSKSRSLAVLDCIRPVFKHRRRTIPTAA